MLGAGCDVPAEAVEDLLGGAADYCLDLLEFRQWHSVVGAGVVIERSTSVFVNPNRHEQGWGDLLGCAPGVGRRLPPVLQAGGVVGRIGRVRQPPVVQPPCAIERGWGRAAEPDRRAVRPVWRGGRGPGVVMKGLPLGTGGAR